MPIDLVLAAGPVPMMRAVADVTRPLSIRTVASLNPIMVDGTGMCGGCRVTAAGKMKFACVDGPEFDAPPGRFRRARRSSRPRIANREDARRSDRHDRPGQTRSPSPSHRSG